MAQAITVEQVLSDIFSSNASRHRTCKRLPPQDRARIGRYAVEHGNCAVISAKRKYSEGNKKMIYGGFSGNI